MEETLRGEPMEALEKKRLAIAICDDEAVPLSRLRQMAEQTLGSHWALEIICTDSPEALLEQADRMQIALLDIQLPEQNGIALAQMLLERNPRCSIIFVSGYVQFVSDVYDVPHLCMVLKDQVDAQLPKYLRRAADATACGDGHLVIRSNGLEQDVPTESIRYLERRGHITYLCLQNGQQVQTREKLDALLDRIRSPYICRCHVSFAANMQWVASMRESEFVMKQGDIVPISRANKRLVKKRYFDYLKSKV